MIMMTRMAMMRMRTMGMMMGVRTVVVVAAAAAAAAGWWWWC